MISNIPREHRHSWVAGMMAVHPQDLQAVVEYRDVECEGCDHVLAHGSTVPAEFVWGA